MKTILWARSLMEKLLPYKQMTAGSVPAGPTILLMCFVWWFAVVTPDGKADFFTYMDPETCESMHKIYMRMPNKKVTDCLSTHETQKPPVRQMNRLLAF